MKTPSVKYISITGDQLCATINAEDRIKGATPELQIQEPDEIYIALASTGEERAAVRINRDGTIRLSYAENSKAGWQIRELSVKEWVGMVEAWKAK